MTELWLSARSAEVSPRLAEVVAGFHVDVFSGSVAEDVLRSVSRLADRYPAIACDLHFVDLEASADLVAAVRSSHPSLREVFAPEGGPAGVLPAMTAGAVARGAHDDTVRTARRILLTAPPRTHAPEDRARTIGMALDRIERLTGAQLPRIAIDRDLDASLGRLAASSRIAELVVGKAVLESRNPIDAALAVARAWRTE